MSTPTPQPLPPLPPAARILGYGGLVPFWVLALWPGSASAPWPLPFALQAWSLLTLYGGLIIGFVGAIAWGVALVHPGAMPAQRQRLLIWSVLPSLGCWLLLGLGQAIGPTDPQGVALVAAGLVGLAALALWHDHTSAQSLPMPAGFARLRTHLTLGATLGLGVGALRQLGWLWA